MKYRNLSHTINILFNLFFSVIGKMNYFNAFWWGVSLGKGGEFIGRCYFKRFPGTKIEIGKYCSFRSHPFSNQIGVDRPCMISTQDNKAIIEIGNNCGFSGTVIASFMKIKIGDNVRCGANTLITDSDWHIDDYRSGGNSPVYIGNNVWLGEGVKVLKGVTIGKNSVIGSGSIVRKSIPPNVIAIGNPCIVIKTITAREEE